MVMILNERLLGEYTGSMHDRILSHAKLPLSRVQSKHAVFFRINQCDVIWGFPYIDTAGIQEM
jgi:hypothetical protein